MSPPCQAVWVALKLAGAAYLVYLGSQALWAAIRGTVHTPEVTAPSGAHELRQGLLSDLGNPKMAAFFTSLLPQFADSFAGLLAPATCSGGPGCAVRSTRSPGSR